MACGRHVDAPARWPNSGRVEGAGPRSEIPRDPSRDDRVGESAQSEFPSAAIARTLLLHYAGDVADPAPRARILLIDDDPLVRSLLVRVLGREYDVESAGGLAEAALRVQADAGFALVLCDEFLGDGLGSAWRDDLRAQAHPLGDRVVLMSGDAGEHAGGPVLRKPFALRELQALVHARIEHGATTGRAADRRR